MSKKLINDPERVVDESLAGLVSVNSGVKLLEGHRVVLRADVQELIKQEKVLQYHYTPSLNIHNTSDTASE